DLQAWKAVQQLVAKKKKTAGANEFADLVGPPLTQGRPRSEFVGDPNAVNRFGHSLLTVAAGEGNLQRVQALLSAGADIHKVNELKVTPLMTAANNGHAEIVRLLLKRGCAASAVDSTGQGALSRAAK